MMVEKVKRQRDAHGAMCRDCDAVFNVSTVPYWHWSKSVWLHQQSGHRLDLYRIVR